jgi:hypothetical protein
MRLHGLEPDGYKNGVMKVKKGDFDAIQGNEGRIRLRPKGSVETAAGAGLLQDSPTKTGSTAPASQTQGAIE